MLAALLRGSSTALPSSHTSANTFLIAFPALYMAASFTFSSEHTVHVNFAGEQGTVYFFTGKREKGELGRSQHALCNQLLVSDGLTYPFPLTYSSSLW